MVIVLTKTDNNKLITAVDSALGVELPNNEKFAVKILDVKLILKKVAVSDTFQNNVQRMLEGGNLLTYPIARSIIYTRQIPTGSTHVTWTNAITGSLPKQCVFGLVEQNALAGTAPRYTGNFLHFGNHGIKQLWFTKNGAQYPPQLYKPEFDSLMYLYEYSMFLENLKNIDNNDILVTPEEWVDSKNLYSIDFNPDTCSNFHEHYDESGTLDVNLTFKEPTNKALTAFLYACTTDIITIDIQRNIYSQTSTSNNPASGGVQVTA